MSKHINIFLFLLFVLGSVSQAAEFWTSEDIYVATKEACLLVKKDDLRTTAADKFHTGIFPSDKFNRLLVWLSRESAQKILSDWDYSYENPLIQHALNSEGFQRALAECYKPQDLVLRQFFVDSVKKSSLRGKYAATMIFAVLGGAGQFAASTAIKLFGVYSKWILGSIFGGMMGTHLWSLFLKNKNLRESTDQACGLNPNDFDIEEKRSHCLMNRLGNSIKSLNAKLKAKHQTEEPLLILLRKEQELQIQIQALESTFANVESYNQKSAHLANLKEQLQKMSAQIEVLVYK